MPQVIDRDQVQELPKQGADEDIIAKTKCRKPAGLTAAR
jgi:hypothetical protein